MPATMQVLAQASESGEGTVQISLWVLAFPLLFLGALLVLGFRRYRGAARSQSPASGRWVTALRTLVDVVFGFVLLVLAFQAFSFLTAADGRVMEAGRLSVSEGRVVLRFENGTSQSIGQPLPADVLEERANSAGKGFDPDDDRLGRVRAEYGSGARLAGIEEITIESRDPSPGLWASALLTLLAGWGSGITFLFGLRTVLASAARGTPFATQTVRWLRVMAVALVVNALGAAIGQNVTGSLLASAGGGTSGVRFHLNTALLGGAFILLALAEVWRYGVTLQRDAEATV